MLAFKTAFLLAPGLRRALISWACGAVAGREHRPMDQLSLLVEPAGASGSPPAGGRETQALNGPLTAGACVCPHYRPKLTADTRAAELISKPDISLASSPTTVSLSLSQTHTPDRKTRLNPLHPHCGLGAAWLSPRRDQSRRRGHSANWPSDPFLGGRMFVSTRSEPTPEP